MIIDTITFHEKNVVSTKIENFILIYNHKFYYHKKFNS